MSFSIPIVGNLTEFNRIGRAGLPSIAISGNIVDFQDIVMESYQVFAYKANFNGITKTSGTVWGIQINGEDSNLLSGDLDVGGDLDVVGTVTADDYNGDVHIDAQSSTLPYVLDEAIIQSGVFANSSAFYNWTRVGNIVTMIGKVINANVTRVAYVPLGNGSLPTWVRGHGFNNNNENFFAVPHSANKIDLTAWSGGSTQSTIHFTASYELS